MAGASVALRRLCDRSAAPRSGHRGSYRPDGGVRTVLTGTILGGGRQLGSNDLGVHGMATSSRAAPAAAIPGAKLRYRIKPGGERQGEGGIPTRASWAEAPMAGVARGEAGLARTDGGRRWVRLPSRPLRSGRPSNSATWGESTQRLYRTDDAGATWRTIGAGSPSFDMGAPCDRLRPADRLLNLLTPSSIADAGVMVRSGVTPGTPVPPARPHCLPLAIAACFEAVIRGAHGCRSIVAGKPPV